MKVTRYGVDIFFVENRTAFLDSRHEALEAALLGFDLLLIGCRHAGINRRSNYLCQFQKFLKSSAELYDLSPFSNSLNEVGKYAVEGFKKSMISAIANPHPNKGWTVQIASGQMEEVLVFTDNQAIVNFGIVPNFPVGGFVETIFGNMNGIQSVCFKMSN